MRKSNRCWQEETNSDGKKTVFQMRNWQPQSVDVPKQRKMPELPEKASHVHDAARKTALTACKTSKEGIFPVVIVKVNGVK